MDHLPEKVLPMNAKSSDVNAKENIVDNRLSNLDDIQLKDLLEEAITYKNPSDRKGKSDIFVQLLDEAEESERIAAASRAGGCELVRHCNPTAKRNHRNRRKQSSSVSENVMHGGSLDNLSNEEFYDNSSQLNKTRKTVSTRQKEGGSLPCHINNTNNMTSCESFLEEARQKKTSKDNRENEKKSSTNGGSEASEGTSQGAADPDKESDGVFMKSLPSKCNISVYSSKMFFEDKRFDENGNLHHSAGNKMKKKKVQSDKNVRTVINAESVEGHRSDIIDDIPKLIQYIGGNVSNNASNGKSKSNLSKTKQLNKSDTEDGAIKKRQRINSSKTKENNRNTLKKCNSLSEISTKTAKENLSVFTAQDVGGKFKTDEDIDMSANKSKEKLVERRSWGHIQTSSLYTTISGETLESIDSWTISRPKKKGKKRRNSLSSSSVYNQSNKPKNLLNTQNRAPSPDLYSKARSTFQSDKSVDSESDAESIHSLPICPARPPISYADVAKNDKFDDKHLLAKNTLSSSEASALNASVSRSEPRSDCNKKNMNSDATVGLLCKEKRCYRTESNERNIIWPQKQGIAANCYSQIESDNLGKINKKICNNNNNKQINNESEYLNKANCSENSYREDGIQCDKNCRVLEVNNSAKPIECQKKSVAAKPDKDVTTTRQPIKDELYILPKKNSIIDNNKKCCNNKSKQINCDLDNNNCRMKLSENAEPPPVVILSGAYNKEVPDLTFGFDINEQLLNEDCLQTKPNNTMAVNCVDEQTNNINNKTDFCKVFMRYVDPKISNISHNHEKIVQYIETAWKQVIKQCNNKVQYYSKDL